MKPKIKICNFGSPSKRDARGKILFSALNFAGIEILDCTDYSFFPVRIFKLMFKLWKLRGRYDFIWIGFPGQSLVFFAKIISRRPIIFDPFISLYNTVVEDRSLCGKKTFKALYLYLLDYFSVHLADIVLIDTFDHSLYFERKLNLLSGKCWIVPPGADENILYPKDKKTNHRKFIVGFYGTYIPLHGIPCILKAAKILSKEKDIEFHLIGKGQTYAESRKLADKLNLHNIIFSEEFLGDNKPEIVSNWDVCMGIFGTTEKADFVVATKIYEYLAMGKPIITAGTKAIRRQFVDGKHMVFTKAGNPEDLAEKIMELKNDPNKRALLSEEAMKIFLEKYSIKAIGDFLKQELEKRLKPLRVNFLVPHIKIAGGTRAFLTYADRLAERGNSVRVLVPMRNFFKRMAGNLFYRKPKWFRNFSARILWIKDYSKENLSQGDALVATAWQTAEPVFKAPKEAGEKFYFIQHYESLYHGKKELVDETYDLPLHKIVISSWLREIIKDKFGSESELVITPVDENLFYEIPFLRKNDRVKILLLDHHKKWKGTELGFRLVNNIKKTNPSVKLIAFGARAEGGKFKSDLYYENPPQSKLAKIYSSCDIYLCPSEWEGLGMPAMEAMACGTALVTFDTGGSRDYAFDGKTAFVAAHGDEKALEEKLKIAVESFSLRQKIAEEGKKYITSHFNWNDAVLNFENILRKFPVEES